MKRWIIPVALIVLVVIGSYGLWAQQQPPSGGRGPMMGRGGMMAVRNAVPTQDGGVVVVSGSQLMKYDANLNLVKAVPVEVDVNDMCRRMQRVWEQCPMYQQMRQQQQQTAQGQQRSCRSIRYDVVGRRDLKIRREATADETAARSWSRVVG